MRKHLHGLVLISCLCLAPGLALSDETTPQVEVGVEQQVKDKWEPRDLATVFRASDEIRFRFRSSFSGNLMLINRSSEGEARVLKSGEDNTALKVDAGQTYYIPDGRGVYEVSGRPGFDTVYWIVTPSSVPAPAVENTPGKVISSLVPRCNPGGLKARGVCTDQNAGVHAADTGGLRKVTGGAELKSRELKIKRQGEYATITAVSPDPGVFIYELRIAHR